MIHAMPEANRQLMDLLFTFFGDLIRHNPEIDISFLAATFRSSVLRPRRTVYDVGSVEAHTQCEILEYIISRKAILFTDSTCKEFGMDSGYVNEISVDLCIDFVESIQQEMKAQTHPDPDLHPYPGHDHQLKPH